MPCSWARTSARTIGTTSSIARGHGTPPARTSLVNGSPSRDPSTMNATPAAARLAAAVRHRRRARSDRDPPSLGAVHWTDAHLERGVADAVPAVWGRWITVGGARRTEWRAPRPAIGIVATRESVAVGV